MLSVHQKHQTCWILCTYVPVFIQHTDMSGKVIVMFTLLAVLLVSSATTSPADAKESNMLQQLLAKAEKVRGRQQPAPQANSARMERRAHLSEDEREIMTKQIMQAISEMMNSECLSDRDYQGWVDFGRRDAE